MTGWTLFLLIQFYNQKSNKLSQSPISSCTLFNLTVPDWLCLLQKFSAVLGNHEVNIILKVSVLNRYWNSCWWPGTSALLHYVLQLHPIWVARRAGWPRELKPTDTKLLYLLLMCYLPWFTVHCCLLYKTPQVPNRPVLKSVWVSRMKALRLQTSLFFSSTICTHRK